METKRPNPWWPSTSLGSIILCAFLLLCFCAVGIRPIPGRPLLTPSSIGPLLIARLDLLAGAINVAAWFFIFVFIRWLTIRSRRRSSTPAPEGGESKPARAWISPGNRWLVWVLCLTIYLVFLFGTAGAVSTIVGLLLIFACVAGA